MSSSVFQVMKDQTIRNYNLHCIDGTLHGCSKCVGFCTCEHHPGFLTAQHERDHQCKEKQCFYHHPKPPSIKCKNNEAEFETEKQIMSIAKRITAHMEGLRILRVSVDTNGNRIIHYATIAGYDVARIENEIVESIGCQVQLKEIQCDFDTAVSLVMQKAVG